MGTSVFTREYHKLIGLNAGQPTLDFTSGVDFVGGTDPFDVNYTVSSSANLIVVMMVSSNGQIPGIVRWDQNGSPQSFTELSGSHRQGVSPGSTFMTVWYLQNPTPGTKTFRIDRQGSGIGISFDFSSYVGAASDITNALPTADVQMGMTSSDTFWNVTQHADQDFTFDVGRKIGIIFQHCQNSIGNGYSVNPAATSINDFRGMSYHRKFTSPVTSRMTPNTQPDGGLAGIFFTIRGP